MNETPFLKIVPARQAILPAISGTHGVITQTDIVFMSYLDPEFNNAELDYPLTFSPETVVSIYQAVAEGSLYDYFNSLELALDKLSLSTNQIISYCDSQRQLIRDNHATHLFLYIRKNEYFVASVRSYAQGQVLRIYTLQEKCTFSVEGNYCLVVPSIVSN